MGVRTILFFPNGGTSSRLVFFRKEWNPFERHPPFFIILGPAARLGQKMCFWVVFWWRRRVSSLWARGGLLNLALAPRGGGPRATRSSEHRPLPKQPGPSLWRNRPRPQHARSGACPGAAGPPKLGTRPRGGGSRDSWLWTPRRPAQPSVFPARRRLDSEAPRKHGD